MQEATCSLKAPSVHHAWALQGSPDVEQRAEDSPPVVPVGDLTAVEPQDRQSTETSLSAVVSSLNRLSLSASESGGLPASLATCASTSGYSSWPADTDLFQSSGLLTAAAPGLPNFPTGGAGVAGINTNGLHSPFSGSTPQLQLQSQQTRRAITGHPSMTVADNFGVPGQTNGARTYASWANNTAQTLNWLQAGRPGPLPTRFGPVHHGRSMSVQNINMTGNSAVPSMPPRKSNQYVQRGGGIFGGVPTVPGFNGQGRAPFLPQVDQFGSRYTDIDEKSLLAGLGQDATSSAGLEAQWLDLIRSAVQDQVRGLTGTGCGWPFSQQMDQNRQSGKGKLPFGLLDNSVSSDAASSLEKQLALAGCGFAGSAGLAAAAAAAAAAAERVEVYSRKVFVGGLPPDIDEDEIMSAFRRFGPLVVDWPHKAESKSYFPPKGYCFLLFQEELSVQALVDACTVDDNKLYWCVSSPTMKEKPVQVRPWNLSDADFVMDGSQTLDPRKTVFVGGVPRPLRAVELAMIMGRLYGGVCYAGIDTDPELRYPKGAGRVAFSSQQSYIAAISARFVQLQHGDIDKRVEVKPYVLDDQICDECAGVHSGGKFAPFFCANVTCLQYYCESCWARIHSTPGREFHKPLVKEGADRPRAMPFRWC